MIKTELGIQFHQHLLQLTIKSSDAIKSLYVFIVLFSCTSDMDLIHATEHSDNSQHPRSMST